MIKAICFDLDGVYFTAESFKRFRKAMSVNVGEVKATDVLNRSDEMMGFKRGVVSENEFWDYARGELKLELSNEEICALLRDSYEVDEKVKESVRLAKEKGFITCICTNNFVTRVRELDEKFAFLRDFDVKILSYEIGELKPSVGIFEELVAQSGVKAEEIVYSDDSAEKLEGADSLGINTFVFESYEQFLEELEQLDVTL